MAAIRQGTIELKIWLLHFRRYKVSVLLNDVIGPLVGGITALLTGRFIGSVLYAGKYIPYAEFLAVGTAATFIYLGILRIFEPTSNSWTKRIEILFADNLPVYFLTTEAWFIIFASVQLIFWVLPIVVATGIPIWDPIIAYAIANIAITPSMAALGFLLSALGLRVRGRDAWAVRSLTVRLLELVMPASFGVSAYGPLAKYLIWVPTVAAMEGTRRIIFGVGGWELIAYAMGAGLLLAVAAYVLFRHMLWKARVKGWILLE